MEKKQVTVHAVTVHMYAIAVIVLGLALLVLGVKYLHLKLSVAQYTESAMWQHMHESPSGSINDYASIIATTVGQYPQTQPLYTQPLQLENYVSSLSKSLKRDIVVMDSQRKILADTVVANMGSKYSSDTNEEISKTLSDGEVRSFTETSKDYPSGLSEVVAPIKDGKGQIIGAVLVSTATISQ